MLKEQDNTWATTLKKLKKRKGYDPRRAKQRNFHHTDDHEESSHLLTSIN